MEKKKILFCGVSLTKFSGLGYVVSNFMKRFQSDNFEVCYATIQGNDTNIEGFLEWNPDFKDNVKEIDFYNCQLSEKEKTYKFDDIINVFKPDVVISFLDPWLLDQIVKSAYRDTFFWLCYLTIETPKYPDYIMYPTSYFNVPRKSISGILRDADLVVPVTQMGKKALTDLKVPTYKDNIYNGLDFSKLPKKKYTKKEVFGEVVNDSDFIFMSMGKNMERKKLDMVVKAFDKFLDKVNRDIKYKLYLHTDIDHIGGGGTDLYQLVINLNLQPHILLPSSFKNNKVMSTEKLYIRYSVCDCYVCLSSGEGFNYGAGESMINKVPIVYIDYGGHSEYLKDIGLPVDVKTTYSAANAQMEWALADIDHCARQMARVVSDVKWRERAKEKGFEFASENFGWDFVYDKLKKALTDHLEGFEKPKIFNFSLKRIV